MPFHYFQEVYESYINATSYPIYGPYPFDWFLNKLKFTLAFTGAYFIIAPIIAYFIWWRIKSIFGCWLLAFSGAFVTPPVIILFTATDRWKTSVYIMTMIFIYIAIFNKIIKLCLQKPQIQT